MPGPLPTTALDARLDPIETRAQKVAAKRVCLPGRGTSCRAGIEELAARGRS